MPNFTARFSSGTSLATWSDPPDLPNDRPSRIYPTATQPHKRRTAALGATVVISATVAGVEGPLDAALGGDLFTVHRVEWPGSSAPLVSSPAGQSSVRSFVASDAGHYAIMLRRARGGGVLLHLDVS